jgi:hypothetical protein
MASSEVVIDVAAKSHTNLAPATQLLKLLLASRERISMMDVVLSTGQQVFTEHMRFIWHLA